MFRKYLDRRIGIEDLERFGLLLIWLFRLRWLASIVTLLLLDVGTYLAFTGGGGPSLFFQQDKIMHFLGFFGFTVMGHISLQFDLFPTKRKWRIGLHIVNVAAWIGYGVFIEVVQSFLRNRIASISDLIANASGILAALVFIRFANLYPRSRPPHG